MGILNVTPDSFSDGGMFSNPARAVAHGRALAADGADIIDVGGESTRPHAERVSVDDELKRVVPVVRDLSTAGVPVSIDTMRAEVAEAAIEAGAVMVNDVSGGLADPNMPQFLAQAGVPCVVMHWRAHSSTMNRHAAYDDVVAEVVEELRQRLDALVDVGVDPERIILDPGLGFSKTAEHNWALLANLDAMHAIGRPLLIGASRKSFLGIALATDEGLRSPHARDDATLAVSALAAAEGAYCVRVHNARSTMDALHVAAAWRAARTASLNQW
ncbi:MAG: dihydropteroate synthase [Actinophytocola sp.]|nr:dihydropteroate synthase [Actinophytocola sp.]